VQLQGGADAVQLAEGGRRQPRQAALAAAEGVRASLHGGVVEHAAAVPRPKAAAAAARRAGAASAAAVPPPAVAAPLIKCYWLDRPEGYSQPLPRGAAQMRTEQEVGAWPCPALPICALHQTFATRDVAVLPGLRDPLPCCARLCCAHHSPSSGHKCRSAAAAE
jgi:hypothetical protein